LSFRIGDLAEAVGAEVAGDPDCTVEAIRTLETAGPEDLSFLTNDGYREQALASRAGALLVADEAKFSDRNLLIAADPALALGQLIDLFHPPAPPKPGTHPTAIVATDARIDPSASVGPYVVVGERAVVGPRSRVDSHVVIGDDCRVGEDVRLHPHVVLYDATSIGDRSIVHAGVVLGSDGYGFASDATGHHKIRHVGRVEVGADVEIGSNSAIDRAVLEATQVGDGTKIDNLVQVGHNVRIGKGCLLVSQAGIAGSSRLGDGVVIAGQSGVAGHLEIGDGVMIAAKSAVFRSVEAGRKVAGVPATDLGAWRRQQALVARLEEINRRLRALETQANRAEGQSDENE